MFNFNEPLGLPQGSVRAIITLLLILAVIFMAFTGVVSEFIISLAAAAFGYYFGTRGTETAAVPRTESEVLVQPQAATPEEEFAIVSGKPESTE